MQSSSPFCGLCTHLRGVRVVRGWGLGLGVAFGRGHAQKHNPYISEAVFVGKYRHSKGPWLWHQQHSTARWLRCGCVGWIGCVENGSETRWTCCCPECGDHVRVSTVDCEVKRMSCQLLRWKGRPDHDSWSNARHRYDFDSLVQWFLLCWISFFFFDVSAGSMGLVLLSEMYKWLEGRGVRSVDCYGWRVTEEM